MDEGGEMAKNPDVLRLLEHHGYYVRPTAPDSSFQNAPGERPHQDVGNSLRAMLHGASLPNKFWSFAFYYHLLIHRLLPHGNRGVPHTRAGGGRGDLSKLRTFGCPVLVRPPGRRSAKLVNHVNRGIFLGYTSTLTQIYYFDVDTTRVKTAFSVKFDEAGVSMDVCSPNAKRLRDALDGHDPEMDATVSSGCPFTALKTIVLNVRCALPNFGIEMHDCAARHRTYLTGMSPSNTGSTLRGWKRNYRGAYIVELNGHVIFNSSEFSTSCTLVHQAQLTIPHPTLSLTLTPERKEAICDPGVSPRLHLDQFHPVIRILSEIWEGSAIPDEDLPDENELFCAIHSITAPAGSAQHLLPLPDLQDSDPNYELGTQPGSKWTRRKLQKLACWSRWKQAKTVQLNSMDKDGMYGKPCRPPVDAIVLRQVWTYNVKYEGTLKARNCCDGSVIKGRGIEYARHNTACISQQGMIIFWAITTLRGWVAIGADAVNAFAQSPPPSEPTLVLIDAQMLKCANG
jgi:hypothetical protein